MTMWKLALRLMVVLQGCLLVYVPTLSAQDGETRVVVCSIQRDQPAGAAARYGITRSDYHWLRQAFPGTAAMRALVEDVRRGERTQRTVVVGCTANLSDLGAIVLIRGRLLTEKDEQTSENVCVISQSLARRLFGSADGIGKNLKLGESYYLVVGVCRDPLGRVCGSHLQSIYKRPLKYNTMLFMPLKTMRARIGDTQVMRTDGSFQIQQYELSEIWAPGDKRLVEAILRRNRAPKDELTDLLITRRPVGFKDR